MKKSGNIKMLCKPTPLAKERGASSLEYLILAAVIIAILVYVNGNDELGKTLQGVFDGLFDKVETEAGVSSGEV